MSDKTTEHPGTVFKRAMDKTVLSRKQVAEELKVGEATLRMFLSGKDPMSLKMARKVAVFFEKYDCFSEDYKSPEYWSSLDEKYYREKCGDKYEIMFKFKQGMKEKSDEA